MKKDSKQKEEKKHCPLLGSFSGGNQLCEEDKCMWWKKEKKLFYISPDVPPIKISPHCAITDIGESTIYA